MADLTPTEKRHLRSGISIAQEEALRAEAQRWRLLAEEILAYDRKFPAKGRDWDGMHVDTAGWKRWVSLARKGGFDGK